MGPYIIGIAVTLAMGCEGLVIALARRVMAVAS